MLHPDAVLKSVSFEKPRYQGPRWIPMLLTWAAPYFGAAKCFPTKEKLYGVGIELIVPLL